MSQEVTLEVVKCSNPNYKVELCRNCIRGQETSTLSEYESFNLRETMLNGYKCDGYEHKNQGSLFNKKIDIGQKT